MALLGFVLGSVVAIFFWFVVTVVRRTKKYPDLGLYVAIVNTVLLPMRLFHLGPFKYGDRLNYSGAMKEAMLETGLGQFNLFLDFVYNCHEIFLCYLSFDRSDVYLLLVDFGDLSFADAYRNVSATKYYHNLQFSTFGFLNAWKEAVFFLSRRLQLIKYFKEAPEIEEIQIKEPIFVFGIGRYAAQLAYCSLA